MSSRSKQADVIIPEDQYNQILPYMRIVGGKKPDIRLYGATLGKGIGLAEKRANDTGLDIRILDAAKKVVAQVEGF